MVIFCQKCIKFYLQPSKFEKFSWGEKNEKPPENLLTEAGKGMEEGAIKGS